MILDSPFPAIIPPPLQKVFAKHGHYHAKYILPLGGEAYIFMQLFPRYFILLMRNLTDI